MKSFLLTILWGLGALCLHAQNLTQTGSLNQARWSHSSQLLTNGKVLAFGGDDNLFSNLSVRNSAELYTPFSGSWSLTGAMNEARTRLTSAILPNGNVLAIGGDDGSLNVKKSCEVYDIATGTWSYTDSMQEARYHHATVVLGDGRVLVAGGEFGSGGVAEIYDPASSTWSTTGTMGTEHGSELELTLLNDGKVLATGGGDARSVAEIYDPAAGTWSTVGQAMMGERHGHSATLLNNGKVLLVGGYNFSSQLSSEIFDPVAMTFTATGSQLTNKTSHPAVKLSNGNVICWDIGDFFSVGNTKIVEIYDVTTGTWSTFPTAILGKQASTMHVLASGQALTVGGSATTGNGSLPQCFLINAGSTTAAEGNVKPQVSFDVFPNPSNRDFEIQFSGSGKFEFQLINQFGVLVSEQTGFSGMSVNVENLPAGIYHGTLMQKGEILAMQNIIVSK